MQWITQLDQLPEFATNFWQNAGDLKVFAVHGPMGAGKTTTIAALAAAKGVRAASSPTFSIINEYAYEADGVSHPFYHIDLYRLRDEEEAIHAGVEDAVWSSALCFVEWPERAPAIMDGAARLYIEPLDRTTRRIRLEK